MSEPLLTLRHVTFSRHEQNLFQPVSMMLKAGEALQICGENGSGKSTLLRIIAGLIEPEQGDVRWLQQSIVDNLEPYQSSLHLINHQNGLKPLLTVRENIHHFCVLANIACTETSVIQIAEKLKLTQQLTKRAHQLSAGQQRRLSLSRLLIKPYRLWLLDEPITALDIEGQAIVATLIEQHLQMQGLVVLSTHHPLTLSTPLQTLALEAHHA